MLYWEQELAGLYLNTGWNDTLKMDVVSNDPEVGPPMVRLRSRSVMHVFTGSMDLTFNEYNTMFKPFVMQKLHGGIDQFYFRSLIDSQTYCANFSLSGGKPYSVKRKSDSLYVVDFTINYYDTGAINEN